MSPMTNPTEVRAGDWFHFIHAGHLSLGHCAYVRGRRWYFSQLYIIEPPRTFVSGPTGGKLTVTPEWIECPWSLNTRVTFLYVMLSLRAVIPQP